MRLFSFLVFCGINQVSRRADNFERNSNSFHVHVHKANDFFSPKKLSLSFIIVIRNHNEIRVDIISHRNEEWQITCWVFNSVKANLDMRSDNITVLTDCELAIPGGS